MFDNFNNNYMANSRKTSKRFSNYSSANASVESSNSYSRQENTNNVQQSQPQTFTLMDGITVYRKDTGYLQHESMLVVYVEENQRYDVSSQSWGPNIYI